MNATYVRTTLAKDTMKPETPSIKLLRLYGGACYDRLTASNTYWLLE